MAHVWQIPVLTCQLMLTSSALMHLLKDLDTDLALFWRSDLDIFDRERLASSSVNAD